MESLVFSAVIVLGIICAFLLGYFQQKKQRKYLREMLRTQYGSVPKREYKAEQYESISHYYQRNKKENTIDDITWNDLDMDRLFMLMNHTHSSAGEEYLYYMLRTPQTDEKELKKTDELAEYMHANEDKRVKLQLLFADLGRTGKYSLHDYIDYLDNLGERNNTIQYMMLLGIALAVILLFFSKFGIILLIGILIYNMASYLKQKSEIEPYFTSYAYILRLIQAADSILDFQVPVLKEYQDELKTLRAKLNRFSRHAAWVIRGSSGGDPAEIIRDYLKMMTHVDIMMFDYLLKNLICHKETISRLLEIMGYIEATISVAAFRAALPYYCKPEFGAVMEVQEMYHPLIQDPVANDIAVRRGILLTGSNASGKSTFLKSVAINAILSQTIYTSMARSANMRFYRIASSMSLRDDLEGGESYYMVEIRSLKRILDAAEQKEIPLLCFVDEVLRGTNTVERIAASTQIMKSLAKANVTCFAATHDIELTHLLEQEYDNYHFTEEVADGDVLFSYKLLEGRATTRNAIQLLRMIGYNEQIIEEANRMAADFVHQGKWSY